MRNAPTPILQLGTTRQHADLGDPSSTAPPEIPVVVILAEAPGWVTKDSVFWSRTATMAASPVARPGSLLRFGVESCEPRIC